jgi:rRNA maturation endonuclease Nob1
MVYACDNCKFLFQRVGEVDSCPDCGKQTVREATAEERAEFELRRNGNRQEEACNE